MRKDRRARTTDLGAIETPPAEDQGPLPGLSVSANFEDFYELEYTGLFGAMCLIAGNRHDAEELTQEAFLKVWERWDLVQGLESPTGYLYRTAMNAFRMRYRRAKVLARKTIRAITRADEFEAFDRRDALDRALASLSPRQRAAVVLTELFDFSSTEAGTTLGIKPATIRKLASKARMSLRDALGDTDG